MSKEWDALPFVSQQRLPITANIPYFYRWKILNIKLLLNDLKELEKKHEIAHASSLYKIVQEEAEHLFIKISEHIKNKQEWQEKLTK